MKLVLASKNQKKLVEMNEILSHLGIQVCSEAEAGVDVEVEETGSTFEENSLLKARAVMEASGMPAIADDSGLCVDALNGAPGVYSARYGGEGLDDTGRYRLLLENMRGQTPRTAKFVSVITCCFPNGDVLSARGECPGTIAFAPMGEGGFGYDPVFFIPSMKKTFAQLSPEEKNAISHRARPWRPSRSSWRSTSGKVELRIKNGAACGGCLEIAKIPAGPAVPEASAGALRLFRLTP